MDCSVSAMKKFKHYKATITVTFYCKDSAEANRALDEFFLNIDASDPRIRSVGTDMTVIEEKGVA